MAFDPRPDHPPAPSGLVARLRLWSELYTRYASGAHLDVSGADALRARAASRHGGRHPAGPDTWPLKG